MQKEKGCPIGHPKGLKLLNFGNTDSNPLAKPLAAVIGKDAEGAVLGHFGCKKEYMHGLKMADNSLRKITKLSAVSGAAREAVRDIEGLPTMEDKIGVYCFHDSKTLVAAARAIYRKNIECDLYLSNEG